MPHVKIPQASYNLSSIKDDGPITSLSQFVERVEKIKRYLEREKHKDDLLFRGQPCDEPLVPRLGRLQVKGNLVKVERLMLKEFKRTSPSLTEFKPGNDWDVLALAQHHGLPTRFLDWTYSAYGALWFAVKAPFRPKAGSSAPRQGVVWVFAPSTADFLIDKDDSSPLDNSSITKVFRPRVIARRIASQGGVFTAHKVVNGKRFVALETNGKYRRKLCKLRILPKDFAALRKDLNMFNVNHAALFPDLDGLTRHLEWRFSWFDDEARSGAAVSTIVPAVATNHDEHR